MRLRWLGTAGVELQSGDTTILIDPDLTRNPQAMPQQPLDPSDFMHVNAVFITHGHFDHIAACGELASSADCPIALHPADLPLWWMHGGAEIFNLQIPDQPEPKHSLKEGEQITVGSLTFEVISLPGHSPGGVGFYNRLHGWLFSGDVVFSDGGVGRTDFLGGNEAVLKESIVRILNLPETVEVYPGHGSPTTVESLRMIWKELL